jgi:hypothetical protein
MRAGIVKGSNAAVFAPDHEHGSSADREVLDEKVTRLRNALLAAETEPGAAEDPLALQLEELRRYVWFDRDRTGAQLRIGTVPGGSG